MHYRGVGRGCGVGRGLGVTLGVALGVGVTVGVTVGVAVGVAVGVTVGVGVAVGVGVGPGVVVCSLRNTAPPAVPAKANPSESIASAQTFPPAEISPLLISLQVSPSFVERKAPPAAPAKM
jgi:hypothetical protein